MKRISLKSVATVTFVLLTAVLVSSPVFAADQNWQGLYVGAHFGAGWGNGDVTISSLPAGTPPGLTPVTLKPDPEGVLAGIQAGYNYQTGIFVVGAEADFSFSNMKGTVSSPVTMVGGGVIPGYTAVAQQRTDWFGTMRLRAGVTPVSQLLLYATGGVAFGEVQYSGNVIFPPVFQFPVSESKTKVGWTVGAGAEYALTRNWSIKAEYLYYDLGNESLLGNPTLVGFPVQNMYDFKTSANIVRAGINYKF